MNEEVGHECENDHHDRKVIIIADREALEKACVSLSGRSRGRRSSLFSFGRRDPPDKDIVAAGTVSTIPSKVSTSSKVDIALGVAGVSFSRAKIDSFSNEASFYIGVEETKVINHNDDDDLLKMIENNLDLGVKIARFTPKEAYKRFHFEGGYILKNGHIYVQHPVRTNQYVPPETYSRVLAKEKESVFCKLAAALGAKTVTLVSVVVDEMLKHAAAGLSLPEVATEVGIKAEFEKSGNLKQSAYMEFEEPHHDPYVPEGLKAWVDSDSDLQLMCQGRIDDRSLIKQRISLEFEEGAGIGGKLAATVADRGFTAGGSYKAIHKSSWIFQVEYWSLQKPAPSDSITCVAL